VVAAKPNAAALPPHSAERLRLSGARHSIMRLRLNRRRSLLNSLQGAFGQGKALPHCAAAKPPTAGTHLVDYNIQSGASGLGSDLGDTDNIEQKSLHYAIYYSLFTIHCSWVSLISSVFREAVCDAGVRDNR